jgi:HD-like signal output (HDOD) protein
LAEVETGGSHSIQTECFTAGLLHDIGKLFLAANLPERYDEVLTRSAQESKSVVEIEEQILGATHAEVAGFVLHTWHLPDSIVEAVHWHHCPGKSPGASGFTALTAVHAANALEHELRTEPDGLVGGEPDWDYLKASGFGERWSEWRLRCTSASAKKWL